ncbi:Hypothetical protein PHPALM_19682 [Phytophthora palmivora]|uniref:Uncharacterized protein n=1 Tax=Phytophthora palmivora TaxID=4796 RepID=A0A2P4XGS5_9STRA|nr:Hypothetical protein PHPALM_19682 [Phytophthora palmivora]
MVDFAEKVKCTMQDLGVTKVYNCDKTGYLLTRTRNNKGSKTVGVKCAGKSKKRATSMLLSDSEGKSISLSLFLKHNHRKIQKRFKKIKTAQRFWAKILVRCHGQSGFGRRDTLSVTGSHEHLA